MRKPPPAAPQDAVFELLGNPETYGIAGAARPVTRYQTHVAVVFLAGDRALKVERAVRYHFLDFSSLEKRKAACEAELNINRKFAPQLYHRIVPITRQSNGALALDGEPVEWAIEMVRFDEDRTLDRLAERGELDDRLIAKLAIAVAALHGRADPVEPVPWIAALEQFIHINTSIFRKHPDLFRESRGCRPRTAIAFGIGPTAAAFGRARQTRIDPARPWRVHLGNIVIVRP